MDFNSWALQILICILILITSISANPVDVTGKNIKYYSLTPNEGSGSYKFDYGTIDGAQRSEQGYIKQEPGHAEPLLVVTGSFKYPDSNGDVRQVYYIADEQGYRIVSKEEVDLLNSRQPKKITDTTKSPSANEIFSSGQNLLTVTKPIFSTTERPMQVTRPTFPVPRTESQVIKLKVIKPPPSKPIECPPGECTGTRQSKIIKIKPITFG